ncbi:Delta-aminolevulinic acid dehydratase [Coxiella burnetii str. Namibia]|nr:Delta-aminolevulinic acid dehydratase [Coxiella burnetii str. Namibia]
MEDHSIKESHHAMAIDALPRVRLRRLRQHPGLRELISEHRLSVKDMILPLFVRAGQKIKNPIASMPGHFQWSVDQLDEEVERIEASQLPGIILFGIPDFKDATGSSALQPDGVVQQAIQRIKKKAPRLLIVADLCFCEYTDHGHCGVVSKNIRGNNDVDNDNTLKLLVAQAISLVRAGADVIAPSGMMDGMVQAIRRGLDHVGFTEIPILSYAVKYASSFYGPFREAAEGTPQFGDRKTYQMNPANAGIALREAELDVAEGADFLMVKPAQAYLDIIYRIKQHFPRIPLGAYQVSGEFAMIKAAAARGWLDETQAMMESLLSIKRAGADFIITYFAKEAAGFLGRE